MTTKTNLIIVCLLAAATSAFASPAIVSLDASRTGDGSEGGGARYLTSVAMADATNVLLNAGFTIGTTDRFNTANIAGAKVLYTGAVSTDFTSGEIADVVAFVTAGGGLVLQRDCYGYYPAADPLAAVFGATFNPGPFGPGGTASPVNQSAAHAIWNGPAGAVTSYVQMYSSSVSGANGIGVFSTNPTITALAWKQVGAGRVVFLTDLDAWDNDLMAAGNNNAIVWENIFHYAVPEPATLALLACGGMAMLRRRR